MNRFLTQFFSGSLRGRRARRHFARHPPVDTIAGRGPAAPAPEELARQLLLAAKDDPAAAIRRLKSHEDGLTPREAAARLARHGPNEVAHDQPLPWWRDLWHCYANPFNLLLTVLAVVSYLGADAKATTVIAVMVVLSTLVRFVQEGRSHRAAESLKAMVSNTATVIRASPGGSNHSGPTPTGRLETPLRKLVPGDLVALAAGDMIPADCRVLTARDLFVAQAATTGESMPVEKFADRRTASEVLLEQGNLVFMGTNVVS